MTELHSLIGRLVGVYEIVELLASNDTGTVYKARDRNHDQFVALRVLPERLARDPEYVARFFEEARIAAQLRHPSIAAILGTGEHDGLCISVSEFVTGLSLAEYLREKKRLDAQKALWIAYKVARALAKAHEIGVLHRAITPDNIMIGAKGRVKVLDFGLAESPRPKTNETESGVRLVVPIYISPEQAREEVVDERTDIYSLGVVLYEMLAGEPPFRAASPAAFLYDMATWPLPVVTKARPDLAPPVAELVTRMMAVDPASRYSSAKSLSNDLATLLRGVNPADVAPQAAPCASAPDPIHDNQLMNEIARLSNFDAPRPQAPAPKPRPTWWKVLIAVSFTAIFATLLIVFHAECSHRPHPRAHAQIATPDRGNPSR